MLGARLGSCDLDVSRLSRKVPFVTFVQFREFVERGTYVASGVCGITCGSSKDIFDLIQSSMKFAYTYAEPFELFVCFAGFACLSFVCFARRACFVCYVCFAHSGTVIPFKTYEAAARASASDSRKIVSGMETNFAYELM